MPFNKELYEKLVVCSKEENQACGILSDLANKYKLYFNGDIGYAEVNLDKLPVEERLTLITAFLKEILPIDYNGWEISRGYIHLDLNKQEEGFEEYCRRTGDFK